jgi:tetratricopeptide (TPR) repeat protein
VLMLLPADDALGRGRVVAQQARIARQLGEHAVAKERYEAAEAASQDCLTDASAAGELRARAWVGYGLLAHFRGNIPEARTWFRKVLEAPGSPREQQQVAHTQLMIAAASARDFDGAAVHAWAAYEAADDELRSGALANLGQVFLDAGHARIALRVFGALLLRPNVPRNELPILGGAAVAAARGLSFDRAVPLIERFANRIQTLMATTQLPFAHVIALADMSDAYSALGAGPAALKMRAQALALSERYGFHEVSHRLREADIAPPLTRVATFTVAAPVAEAVQSFEATEEVELALQPA